MALDFPTTATIGLIYTATNGVVYTYDGLRWRVTTAGETDPIYNLGVAASISAISTSQWNLAYSYGNHATRGYLTATIGQNVLPSADATYDLGSTSSQWRSLYVSTNTIYIGQTALSVFNNEILIEGYPYSPYNQALSTSDSPQFLGVYANNFVETEILTATNTLILGVGSGKTWSLSTAGVLTLPAGGDIRTNTGTSLLTGNFGPQGPQGVTGPQGPQGQIGGPTFIVTNSGASDYVINGTNDPSLNLIRGFTYYFNVSAPGHPFWIKTAAVTGTGSAYSSGVTNNGTQTGILTFQVPFDAPTNLYYICQIHGSMSGSINISDLGPEGPQGPQGPGSPYSDIFTITNTTSATSTITGALIVEGGVGIGGSLWVNDLRLGSQNITLGTDAGSINQGLDSVAIGSLSGYTDQGIESVAVGSGAGQIQQGTGTVAIGYASGNTGQGAYAVAIGKSAGYSNQPENTIILNATGLALNGATTSSFYVAPIRSAVTGIGLYYEPTTGEITTGTVAGGGGGSSGNPNVTNVFMFNSNSNYGMPANSETLVPFDATTTGHDAGDYDTSTKRFTPTVAGWYDINVRLSWSGSWSANVDINIWKNNSLHKIIGSSWIGNGGAVSGSALVYFDGISDYTEVKVIQKSGGFQSIETGASKSWMQCVWVRD